jgi:predicted tellurium resistance membrane protein TerC
MDVDWQRFLVYTGVVIAIYYLLLWFSPLRRLPRNQQFLVFGGIVFVTLVVLGLIWP